jgi:hypothetical protein
MQEIWRVGLRFTVAVGKKMVVHPMIQGDSIYTLEKGLAL